MESWNKNQDQPDATPADFLMTKSNPRVCIILTGIPSFTRVWEGYWNVFIFIVIKIILNFCGTININQLL